MGKNKKQSYEGVVYSTDDNYNYQFADVFQEVDTLPANQQNLKVQLDRKMRKGKVVTLVTGFVGQVADLESLGKLLKQKCGVGGSVKDGEIMIQGEFKQKIYDLLLKEGYRVKMVGG
ncbi:translation initiation factor [Sphingobacterium sp. N143]|mgnify:CR=1 FL=1|uniref:translation initiation factor n=1 Tax=Sphingobacterium sp. N143 TaxID=2746727 RepID=UPI002574D1FF|nr:translation initiation factor [Sphingobacterium sp. N143]MDM1296761.1 translation initiation factor [Sphingobacterium sp. N143]